MHYPFRVHELHRFADLGYDVVLLDWRDDEPVHLERLLWMWRHRSHEVLTA